MIQVNSDTYEIKLTANGMPNFYKNGERVKGKSLPVGMREALNQEVNPAETIDELPIVQDDENKKTNSDVLCLFCQQPADSGKTLNGKFVALCREDYLTKNLGKVAQRVRELNGATNT
jgi:hypothetical protein